MRRARGAQWRRLLPHLPWVLAVVVYANALPGDFVLDDIVLLEEDSALRSFDLERIFASNYWGSAYDDPNYRPLTLLSYALNHQVSAAPWTFHLVNVLLNVAVVALFYRVGVHLFSSRLLACLAASLFAVFPIHTEAVTNVVGRAELLAALALVSAWLAVQGAPRGEGSWRPLVAGGFVFIGLFAKENAAAAVALLPAALYLTRRVVAWRTALSCGVAVLAYLGCRELAIGDSLERIAGAVARPLDNPLAAADFAVRVVNAVGLVGVYFLKVLVPLRLSADYSYNQLPVIPLDVPLVWARLLGVVALSLVALAFFWRRAPVVALGVLFFLVALLPVSNIVFPIGTIFGERLAYTPSAGLALALVGILAWYGERETRGAGVPALLVVVAFAVVGLYAGRTVVRNRAWADRVTMNLRVALDAPASARAHQLAAQGQLLLSRRQRDPAQRAQHLDLAGRESARALEIRPDYPLAQAFLAEVLLEQERPEPARAALLRAEELYRDAGLRRPPGIDKLRGMADVRVGMKTLAGEGEAAARPYFESACSSFDAYLGGEGRGGDTVALKDRATARAQLGDRVGAREDLDTAIRVRGDEPELYNNRGYLRFLQEDYDGAAADYRRGLEICRRRGALFPPAEHNVFIFHRRLFDLYLAAGDEEKTRAELAAMVAMAERVNPQAATELEARLRARFGE